ncbi:MAG: EAL domain-containing protein [Desulfuromonadales bacterium]|nr:EAL domain-containing protein [Desulfuromonadales bacterium]
MEELWPKNIDISKSDNPLVLIVDDDKFMRSLLRETLEEGGYATVEADCGIRALQMVGELSPDMILLDIVMPGLDGFETCLELRRDRRLKDIPILMITALESPETIHRAYAAGATDYLVKPIVRPNLRHHVRYLLRAHRTSEDLRKQKERLLQAQRIARLGDWEWNERSEALHCSREALRILLQPESSSPIPFAAFLNTIHPDDREKVQQSFQMLLEQDCCFNLDFRLQLPDGSTRDVHGQGETVPGGAGKVRLLAGTLQDITERKAVEEKLLLSAKFFENSSEMIMVLDDHGRIIDVNPAFCRLTGRRKGEDIGRFFTESGAIHLDVQTLRKLWAEVDAMGKWQGEVWHRPRGGEPFPALVNVDAVKKGIDEIGFYIWSATDISKLKETEERIRHLIRYDFLTDLPNRSLFHERLNQILSAATRRSALVAVLALDIDSFKEFNDTLGHMMGDEILRKVAQRIKSCVRESDVAARLGGDEFAIILWDLRDSESVAVVVQRILELLASSFLIENREFFLSTSAGIALFPDDDRTVESLVNKAEAALKFAKKQGGNRFHFFSEAMNTRAQERLSMKTALRYGLDRNEIFLHYQPKYNTKSGVLVGMEALARWQNPDLGLVPPSRFIPLAEENGLIIPLGERVLRLACTQNRLWQEQGFSPFRMAVNLSACQFREDNLAEKVERVLSEAELSAEWVELEITESAIMQDTDRAISVLKRLRDKGIRIALDDFGTGYSSLSYLTRFPVDSLKIDHSFVRNMFRNEGDVAIVRAIIAMAHSLGIKVIAEGVETEEERIFLLRENCDEIQGYLSPMPQAKGEIEKLLPEKQI